MIFRFTAGLTRQLISFHPSRRQVALRPGWSHDELSSREIGLVVNQASAQDIRLDKMHPPEYSCMTNRLTHAFNQERLASPFLTR